MRNTHPGSLEVSHLKHSTAIHCNCYCSVLQTQLMHADFLFSPVYYIPFSSAMSDVNNNTTYWLLTVFAQKYYYQTSETHEWKIQEHFNIHPMKNPWRLVFFFSSCLLHTSLWYSKGKFSHRYKRAGPVNICRHSSEQAIQRTDRREDRLRALCPNQGFILVPAGLRQTQDLTVTSIYI